ncbi:hypothetical protein SS50377_23585 [Spironucleus salmonicida]|nr:hypothetical protein SS50377_23585 [Spironucleus salmonicida]
MLARLEQYMDECNKTFNVEPQTHIRASVSNYEPSQTSLVASTKSTTEQQTSSVSVIQLSQLEYKPVLNKKIDLPDFWDLRSKFLQYDTIQLLDHSLFRTIHFSRYENSQIFSYQLQSIFCDKIDLRIDIKAQFMIQQFCIRILPVITYITQNMQNIPEITNFMTLINQTFNTSLDFDFEQFLISFSIDQPCYSSKENYLFTISFISIFTIFSFLHEFQTSQYQINDESFKILEDAFKAYFQSNNNFLSLYNIYDYMLESAIHIKYSCFAILRLYQQIASDWYIQHSILDSYISHVVLETQDLILKVQAKRLNEIPVYIVILESLAQPVCSILIGANYDELEGVTSLRQSVSLAGRGSKELSRDSQKAINSLKLVIKQIIMRFEQYNEAMNVPNVPTGHFLPLGLLLHSLSYNLFFLTSIFGFENCQEILNNAGSIDDSEYIIQIIQSLIKFSTYFENENLRTYTYEQVTQFFLKTRRECFINVFIDLINKNQNSGCFDSIHKYFIFLKFNYPGVLQQFGSIILEQTLPISKQIFQTYIQTKGSKQLVHDLLKIVSVVSRVCDKIQSINLQNHSMIYFSSIIGQISIFDYMDYQKSSIIVNDNSNFDLIRSFEIKDKFIFAISLNSDKLIFIRAGIPDLLIIPIIPEQGNALFSSIIIKKRFIPSENFVFVSTTEADGKFCITFSNHPSNSIHQFRLRSLDIQKNDDYFGYFKYRQSGSLSKNLFSKKLIINCVIEEDTVQFIVKQ